MKRALLVVCGLAAAAMADGTNFPLDVANGTFQLFTTNSNDGYSSFRGVVFTADAAVDLSGASLWTEANSQTLNATFELWSVTQTSGNVLNGATLERTFNAQLSGDLGFHGGKWDTVFTTTPGQSYLIRAGYQEAANQNWFFSFDPVFFGDTPVDLGDFTVIDGTLGGDTSNFVMPLMGLQVVPAPSGLALLGLGGLMATRRRR